MKNLMEEIQKKNALGATAMITKALKAKTVAAIAEARKQVAVEIFGDGGILDGGVISEVKHQEHRRAEKAAAPMAAKDKSKAKQDWDNDVRMPWPKSEPRSNVGVSSSALTQHRFAEAEIPLKDQVCSQCAPGHAGKNGLCKRHGKKIKGMK